MSLVIDLDDFGINHIISDMCQSHDCRDKLDQLHYVNPAFKVTLFAIPGEMTYELCEWCKSNSSWIELAVHGLYHSSNYECEKMTIDEFDAHMENLAPMLEDYFVKGFKAPGWQISNDIYKWLQVNDWWVADQSYNDKRRPKELPAYTVDGTKFIVWNGKDITKVEAWHGHTWDVGWNGIYEAYDQIEQLVKSETEFRFVSEVLNV